MSDKQYRVLIANPDGDFACALQDQLQAHGADSAVAVTPQDALRLAQDTVPTLMIIDVAMMSAAPALCRDLQDIAPQTPLRISGSLGTMRAPTSFRTALQIGKDAGIAASVREVMSLLRDDAVTQAASNVADTVFKDATPRPEQSGQEPERSGPAGALATVPAEPSSDDEIASSALHQPLFARASLGAAGVSSTGPFSASKGYGDPFPGSRSPEVDTEAKTEKVSQDSEKYVPLEPLHASDVPSQAESGAQPIAIEEFPESTSVIPPPTPTQERDVPQVGEGGAVMHKSAKEVVQEPGSPLHSTKISSRWRRKEVGIFVFWLLSACALALGSVGIAIAGPALAVSWVLTGQVMLKELRKQP